MGKPASKSPRSGNKKNPALAWRKRRAPSRGPKPGMSMIEIAHAAIRIADREGLAAVTMQRVARRMGVTTMALYRYFPGKADLLAIMIDSAGIAVPRFSSASDWKDRLREWARACASIYRDHLWFLEATTVRRSVIGPNELAWMEAALAILEEAGLSPRECCSVFLAIMGHIRGHATLEQIKSNNGAPPEWMPELTRLMDAQDRRYPVVRAALQSGAFTSGAGEAFEFGLNCILNGISPPNRSHRG